MKRKNRAKVIFAATISAAMVLSTFAIPVSALSETGQEIAVSAEWDDAAEMSPIGDAAEEAPDAAAELEELPDIAIAPDHYIHLDETNDEPAQDADNDSTVSWTLDGDTLKITGSGTMDSYSYRSNAPWYDKRSSIKHIVIAEGITSIGDYAFYNLNYVESISVPSSLTSVGTCAFAECYALKSVALPSAVTALTYGVFAECHHLNSLTANGITSVGGYALSRTKLTAFHVNAKVTSISNTAFLDTPIENFTVDNTNPTYSQKDGVLYIDNGKTLFMFPGGRTDDSYTIPFGVTKLAESSFTHCNLKSVTISDNVTETENYIFSYSKNLTDVHFGNGLKEITNQSFRSCTSLKNITFGKSIRKIGNLAFSYCSGLEKVEFPSNITEIGNGTFGECSSLRSFKSTGVKAIPFQAFMNCYALTDVSLTNLTTVNRAAFAFCRSLNSITLPASVNYVHPYGFYRNGEKTRIYCLNSKLRSFGYNGYRELQSVSVKVEKNYDYAKEILRLVNEERSNNGLEPLVLNSQLMKDAMLRAGECALCFSHTRPDSSSVFELDSMINAENIACGQTSPSAAMTSWMNSDGHKKNILGTSYHSIGIGCIRHNGTYYWVQCFGTASDTVDCSVPANKTITQQVSFAVDKFSDALTGTSTSFSFGGSNTYQFDTFTFDIASPVRAGEKVQATAYINNAGGTGRAKLENDGNIKWKSSNEKMAEVSAKGIVTGRVNGTIDITASTLYYSSTKTITVQNGKTVAPTGIQLNKTAVTLGVGEQYTLKATITPSTATDKSVTWISKNNNVVSVSDSGTITANKEGTATIVAVTANGRKATAKITVTPTRKLVNQSTVSKNVTLGNAVRIKADAEGGKGTYTYAVSYKKSTSKNWTVVQYFKEETSVTFTPNTIADYDVCVKVKDSSGTVAKQYFTVSVTRQLTNKSTISAQTIKLGEYVKTKAFAAGGKGDYTYSVSYKKANSSQWITVKNYGTQKTAVIKPRTAATYDVCVKVKDSSGTVAKKYFMLKVTG